MKSAEAAMVLAAASGVDNRKHGELQAKMWARILGDIDLRDALEAVEVHYSTSDKFLMPVHVIEGAKKCRDERLGRERRAALDAQIEAENAGELTARPIAALTAGQPVPYDDPTRAERRRLLQQAAHSKREQVAIETAERTADQERREQARREIAERHAAEETVDA